MPKKTMISPLGPLTLVEENGALCALRFADEGGEDETPVLCRAQEELEGYFQRKRSRFTLPLAPKGTAFQLRVWKALEEIPYGETISYRELARRADCPKGFQAVGQANGRNPLPIVIPCHRVIAADGSLGGYSGGLARKQALLDLEKSALP